MFSCNFKLSVVFLCSAGGWILRCLLYLMLGYHLLLSPSNPGLERLGCVFLIGHNHVAVSPDLPGLTSNWSSAVLVLDHCLEPPDVTTVPVRETYLTSSPDVISASALEPWLTSNAGLTTVRVLTPYLISTSDVTTVPVLNPCLTRPTDITNLTAPVLEPRPASSAYVTGHVTCLPRQQSLIRSVSGDGKGKWRNKPFLHLSTR